MSFVASRVFTAMYAEWQKLELAKPEEEMEGYLWELSYGS